MMILQVVLVVPDMSLYRYEIFDSIRKEKVEKRLCVGCFGERVVVCGEVSKGINKVTM